ncbi:hypothetical protein [Aureimonas phyllosphaerae]|uniref:Uncharacterized protein n=1 Tax=Aureimonas phyllosphaerae TaxID=1166078 RepID=A0A7W6BWG9_9HYPH|nr:hypothetical protein [Aureimonas phyllosphaerae]MBB3938197.1 hypothetical protein [Aureimonas phyllosphaerae]MBB3962220.1 hypothetical protein [Aureimonas phyllosphaerae]
MPHPDHDYQLGNQLEALACDLEQSIDQLMRLKVWDRRTITNLVLQRAIGFLPHDTPLRDQPAVTLVEATLRVQAMIAITEAMVHHGGVRPTKIRTLLNRIGNLLSHLRRLRHT